MRKLIILFAVVLSVGAGVVTSAQGSTEPCSGCTPPGPECCVADGVYLGKRGGTTPPPVETEVKP
jgi:hypothetical protein